MIKALYIFSAITMALGVVLLLLSKCNECMTQLAVLFS